MPLLLLPNNMLTFFVKTENSFGRNFDRKGSEIWREAETGIERNYHHPAFYGPGCGAASRGATPGPALPHKRRSQACCAIRPTLAGIRPQLNRHYEIWHCDLVVWVLICFLVSCVSFENTSNGLISFCTAQLSRASWHGCHTAVPGQSVCNMRVSRQANIPALLSWPDRNRSLLAAFLSDSFGQFRTVSHLTGRVMKCNK